MGRKDPYPDPITNLMVNDQKLYVKMNLLKDDGGLSNTDISNIEVIGSREISTEPIK